METVNPETSSNILLEGSGAVASNKGIASGKGGNAAGRDVHQTNVFLQQLGNHQKKRYYVFFSCEHVDDCESFRKFLQECKEKNTSLPKLTTYCDYKSKIKAILENADIKFIGRHNFNNSIKRAYEYMKNGNRKNCIFILNSHQPVNEITYFQIGYALGKGIEILGLFDEDSSLSLPVDIENILDNAYNMDDFISLLEMKLEKIKPTEQANNAISDVNTFFEMFKMEMFKNKDNPDQ